MRIGKVEPKPKYTLAESLDILSQFLQLHSEAGQKEKIAIQELYNNYFSFKDRLGLFQSRNKQVNATDTFFRKELNEAASLKLYKLIKKRYPGKYFDLRKPRHLLLPAHDVEPKGFWFPNPAPFPSSSASKNHFLPDLKTLQQVDNYLHDLLDKSGYKGHYKYFYVKPDGFAITTGLERINKSGTTDAENRWTTNQIDKGFSLYNIFKTMFFANDANFRVMAIVVSPQEVETKKEKTSFAEINKLVKEGYNSLPGDLENRVLENKALSVFVYHFYQSDTGEVPQLNTTGKLSVFNHLNGTPLYQILK